MPRSPCTFKQRDVTKAVKAVVAAGVQVARVTIDREGKIAVEIGKPVGSAGRNEWDEVLDGAPSIEARQFVS
jgi:hypothetical protein